VALVNRADRHFWLKHNQNPPIMAKSKMAQSFRFICNSCDETIESCDEGKPSTTLNASTRRSVTFRRWNSKNDSLTN
jgi:hypothetical protein